jgi:hypothetical protein
MNKEELIEKIGPYAIRCYSQIEWNSCVEECKKLGLLHVNLESRDFQKYGSFAIHKSAECEETKLDACYTRECSKDAKEFLSWFKETPIKTPKKRDPKKKLCKRERADANIKAQRETLDISEERIFNCRGGEDEMDLLASYFHDDGYEYFNEPHKPKDALRVAKWIIDLEGR